MKLHKDETKIIAIMGEWSDIVAKLLEAEDYRLHKESSSMKRIVTYTTLPLRDGETQGDTEMHLSEMPKLRMSDVLLYRQQEGYDFWVLNSQCMLWDKNIICCDKEDIEALRKKEGKDIDGWRYKLVSIRVDAKGETSETMVEPEADFVMKIDSDGDASGTVAKKVKMLHTFIQKNRKGLWL